jgi:hypothetical protein
LRLTARESRHLSPKPAFGLFMDYNGVLFQPLILAYRRCIRVELTAPTGTWARSR